MAIPTCRIAYKTTSLGRFTIYSTFYTPEDGQAKNFNSFSLLDLETQVKHMVTQYVYDEETGETSEVYPEFQYEIVLDLLNPELTVENPPEGWTPFYS